MIDLRLPLLFLIVVLASILLIILLIVLLVIILRVPGLLRLLHIGEPLLVHADR